jgi:hypothetical protein
MEKRRREQELTWTVQVKLPADVVNPGRFMARVLKGLLRRYRVRCVALMDNRHGEPDQRVETD